MLTSAVPFRLDLHGEPDNPSPNPDQPTDPAAVASADPDAPTPKVDDDPGPAGGADALRADLAKERDRRQSAQAELDEMRKQLEALQSERMSETEKAIEEARREGASSRDADLESERRATDEYALRSVAAGVVIPGAEGDVASLMLTEGVSIRDADGRIDPAAAAEAVKSWVQARPHYQAPGPEAPPVPPPIDGGPRSAVNGEPAIDTDEKFASEMTRFGLRPRSVSR